jgi:Uma2 family endonuclease
MTISAKTYEQVALEDPDGHWELECGRLRQKPAMTMKHGRSMRLLMVHLARQLDLAEYEVEMDFSRLRVPSGQFYIPDLAVIPTAYVEQGIAEQPNRLDVYEQPLPLVVEVWSPSTGDYDVEVKLRGYQERGDVEIWRLHPIERTLTAWRRQPDGSYVETVYREGVVEPVALPGVRIELSAIFR